MRPLRRLPPDVFGGIAQYLDVSDVARTRAAVRAASQFQFPVGPNILNTRDSVALARHYDQYEDARALEQVIELYRYAPQGEMGPLYKAFEVLYVPRPHERLPPAELEDVLKQYLHQKVASEGIRTLFNFMYLLPSDRRDLVKHLVVDQSGDRLDEKFMDEFSVYMRFRFDNDLQHLSFEELLQYPCERWVYWIEPGGLKALLERFSDTQVIELFRGRDIGHLWREAQWLTEEYRPRLLHVLGAL